MTHKKLDKLVDSFLANYRKTAMGGWAAIADTDMNDLAKIIGELIDLKCEADADGDRPIEFRLTNRLKGRQAYRRDIPYDHKFGSQAAFDATYDNLESAIREFHFAKTLFDSDKKNTQGS